MVTPAADEAQEPEIVRQQAEHPVWGVMCADGAALDTFITDNRVKLKGYFDRHDLDAVSHYFMLADAAASAVLAITALSFVLTNMIAAALLA